MKPLTIVGSCSTGVGNTLGGSGQTARRIFRCMRDLGHNVHVVGMGPSPAFAEDHGIPYHGVEPVEYEGLWTYPNQVFPLAERIAKVADELGADLLHAHYLFPWGWAIWQAQQILFSMTGRRIPIVQRPAGTDITRHVESFPGTVRLLLQSADVNIINTRAFAQVVADSSGLGEALRYVQVYNPIPESFHHVGSIFRESYDIPKERFVIGVVGNFRKVKRAHMGVEVLHRLVARGVDAVLLMIGEGPELAHCRQLADELGLYQRVFWVGRLDRMASAYSSIDMLLHTSAFESFGLAIAEAARCGVPAVASNVGGVPEVLADGETGFLCAPDNVEDYVRHSYALATDLDLRRRMGEQAASFARAKFDALTIAKRYEEIFRSVL